MKYDFSRQFLPFVEKPDRYIGQETGLPEFPHQPDLRVALAFPDLYELGMSYLGLHILYHLGNRVEGVVCERIFMPWFDAVARMKQLRIPLFTLETRTPLNRLDLLGVHLQYELHATNVLAMLHLGNIPLFAGERGEEDPIVIGGGPLVYSPEPLAPFFDAFAVGDGEELWVEILETLKREKKMGTPRERRIRSLGDLRGVYLPHYYRPDYSKSGAYRGLKRLDAALPERIPARILPLLRRDYYPAQPLIPTLEATHSRLVLEIARGCSRGCRFCEPGMVNRPVREREVEELVEEADAGLAATGYSEVSLLSLSTADYRALDQLLEGLQPILEAHRASLSFPSLRPDKFTPQMAERAGSFSRTGLTFAPEAATDRLRRVINKPTSDEALLKAAELAFSKGWRVIKLYFMIGLPTETEEDIRSMVNLVREVDSVRRREGGKQINVSLSPFSPKPHTPFEREGQISPDDVRKRYALLIEGLRRHRSVKLDLRDPRIALVETALIRGDRAVGKAIEHCYRSGGLFDAWSDGFRAERWERAFVHSGGDLQRAASALPESVILPWKHIDAGIGDDFLRAERKMAARPRFTPDCREAKCHYCGLQLRDDLPCPDVPPPPKSAAKPTPSLRLQTMDFRRFRLLYRRTEAAMFHAHLSVVAAMEKALRRLGVPLEFTRGFKPHVRLIASPPLGVGIQSSGEYVEFGIGVEWTENLFTRLREALPPGVEPVRVFAVPGRGPSLGSLNVFLYRVSPWEGNLDAGIQERIVDLLSRDELPFLRPGRGRTRSFDARPSLWKLEVEGNSLLVGIRSAGGPVPRLEEILEWLLPEKDHRPLPAHWRAERLGMWWKIEDKLVSPDGQTPVGESELKS